MNFHIIIQPLVNLWLKEPYVFYSCSHKVWEEGFQQRAMNLVHQSVAEKKICNSKWQPSTQQPKKMVCTLSKTICWSIKKGWSLKSHSKFFKIWNLKTMKKVEFGSTVVRTLFKVLVIFTWKMKRCKTDCVLDQTGNLKCGLYSQHH